MKKKLTTRSSKEEIVEVVNELYEETLKPEDVAIYESHMQLFDKEILEKATKEDVVEIVHLLLKDNSNARHDIEEYLLQQANIFYVENCWLKANPATVIDRSRSRSLQQNAAIH